MSIDGCCHDFAFTICYPENVWKTKSAAKSDEELYQALQKYMVEVDPYSIDKLNSGVLTVVNDDDKYPGMRCCHSYFVDAKKYLISVNDPLYTNIETKSVGGIKILDVSAFKYSLDALKVKLHDVNGKRAKVGKRESYIRFYWCSIEKCKSDWWTTDALSKKKKTGFLSKIFFFGGGK